MKIKQLLCFLLAFALVLTAFPVAFAAEKSYVAPFTDVPTSQYYAKPVAWAVENGITSGTAKDKFSPKKECTRGQIVTFLWRLAGSPTPSAETLPFKDVKKKDYFYNAVAWAVENGITSGTAPDRFGPKDACTRAQAMTFLWKYAGSPMPTASENPFQDVKAKAYYANAVLWAVENGITSGTSKTTFGPKQSCTRAQIVTFLYHYHELVSRELVYGTATLRYAEFYAGDVSSTESYDGVSSATNTKYALFKNAYTDFVDAETNADGYHILGVQNVNVAVAAEDVEAYKEINPTFVQLEEAPAQYKTVTVSDGKAVYSATNCHVEEVVTDATAEVQYGSNWGDYQINVTDPEGKAILRNGREDDFPVNSSIQGIILETASGLKVGLEYLQSIWVQPCKLSFNVSKDNTHNTRIAQWDNLPELDKLEGETVTKITYVMPNGVYVYEFAGIKLNPIYDGSASAQVSADKSTLSFVTMPEGLENPVLTVTYTVGSGRAAVRTVAYTGALAETVTLDTAAIAEAGEDGVFSAVISSDNYATIRVNLD